MTEQWADSQRKTLEKLFPKLDMAGYRLETGSARTILNIGTEEYSTLTFALQKYQQFLNSTPVESEPKRGVWLNWHGEPILPNEFYRWWTCSECKHQLEFDEAITVDDFTSNYCPNCGAKMDEERRTGDAGN